MDIDTRLSVLEARNDMIRSLVKSSIGWTLVLTVAVVGAALAVNSQFNSQFSALDAKIVALDAKIVALDANSDSKIVALESKFDRRIDELENKLDHKIDALQNLIVRNMTQNFDGQGMLAAENPVEEPKLQGDS